MGKTVETKFEDLAENERRIIDSTILCQAFRLICLRSFGESLEPEVKIEDIPKWRDNLAADLRSSQPTLIAFQDEASRLAIQKEAIKIMTQLRDQAAPVDMPLMDHLTSLPKLDWLNKVLMRGQDSQHRS